MHTTCDRDKYNFVPENNERKRSSFGLLKNLIMLEFFFFNAVPANYNVFF